ncbi:Uncharacterised protein [Mycobacteroides abscessus subsp. abscessus]|nr:Uncharacterised protein [Mycobacteroides abscessus subsp. abscessus]
MRFSFLFVGIQHVCRQLAVEYSGQFPGEIGRVSDSSPHALSHERRCQVSGIAENEHIAITPVAGDVGTEGVFGDPNQGQLADRARTRPESDQWSQFLDGVVVCGGLAGVQFEFPAIATFPDSHECGRSVRVAQVVHAVPVA